MVTEHYKTIQNVAACFGRLKKLLNHAAAYVAAPQGPSGPGGDDEELQSEK